MSKTKNGHQKSSKLKDSAGRLLRWAIVTQDEIRGESVDLSARIMASNTLWNKLDMTEEQRILLDVLYATSSTGDSCHQLEDHVFSSMDDVQQDMASSLLAMHGLDEASIEDIGSRWSIKWSQNRGNGMKAEHRVLFQCDCGREHTQFGSLKRKTGVDFTGCLAHAEVIFMAASRKVLCIRGYFVHNDARKTAVFARAPPIPLHPSVYTTALLMLIYTLVLSTIGSTPSEAATDGSLSALAQLREGASLTAIQAKNRELYNHQAYLGQKLDMEKTNYCWMIKRYDTCALYRQYNRLIGVNTKIRAEININEWLDPTSQSYNKTLTEAVFHYAPRAARNEHFEMKKGKAFHLPF
ncbi:hypothetical protein M422DRAFT_274428 [Sphaerobolus stellatus SS14]|uniref:Uncharacterized protein n=1 Tax=Sphaerobolus stellatus (strain SS14) TaxID=990650 RepID=A0A0C9TS69_SPHS4|nr:hypothetical protein M422DRAFT_274428 [Sphaerobolus stellatus SS14]